MSQPLKQWKVLPHGKLTEIDPNIGAWGKRVGVAPCRAGIFTGGA